MKVLIIGANGFLGRNLVKKCLQMMWEVDCVFNRSKRFIPKQCKYFHIDDLEKLDNSYDAIFLLPAFIPYGYLNSADERLIEVNIKIPLRVVQKFNKSKIIFSSSASVYGVHNSTIYENSSFDNPSLYGLSKLAVEFILRIHEKYQIIRFSSLYGTGMTSETFISRILNQAKKTKKITLFGNGSRFQNYLYIEDAIGYLIAATKCKKPGVYLGVGDKAYSNSEIAKIIQRLITGCKIEYIGQDNSPSFIYNNSITRRLINFTPQFSLERGMECMIRG